MNENTDKQSFGQEDQTAGQSVEPEIITPASEEKLKSARNVTTLVYALQVASLLVGITFLIGVVVNYVKLNDVRGTWLESHFRWQIRTFWFALLWSVVGFFTLGLGIGFFILIANSVVVHLPHCQRLAQPQ